MRVQQSMQRLKGGSVTKTTIPTVHAVYLLDASTSMAGWLGGDKYTPAIRGILDDIKLLREETAINYTISVYEFATKNYLSYSVSSGPEVMDLVKHFTMRPIVDIVRPFTPRGADGNTPLYQAVGETIEEIESLKSKDDKVLLNIFTDGEENKSSGKYASNDVLRALINRVEKDSGFTVTFQGTERDIRTVVDKVGINFTNTLAHDNTVASIISSNSLRSAALHTYSKAVADGEDVKEGFYTKTMETENSK